MLCSLFVAYGDYTLLLSAFIFFDGIRRFKDRSRAAITACFGLHPLKLV